MELFLPFATRISVTSTPIAKVTPSCRVSKRRVVDDDKPFEIGKNDVSHLIRYRQIWPRTFKLICQDYLNELGLPLDKNCLSVNDGNQKIRQRQQEQIRSRSRSCNRSSPRKPTNSDGISNDEMRCVSVIDYLTVKTEMSATALILTDANNKESKRLYDKLCETTKVVKWNALLNNSSVTAAIGCLYKMLKQLAPLIPAAFADQFVIIGKLILRKDKQLCTSKRRMEAVQTMMLNISSHARQLMQHLFQFLDVIRQKLSKDPSVIHKLAVWLAPILFDVDLTDDVIRLTEELIELHKSLFHTPESLNNLIIKRWPSKDDNDNVPMKLARTKSSNLIGKKRRSFSKSNVRNDESITLVNFSKIKSPEKLEINKQTENCFIEQEKSHQKDNSKRKSLIDAAKGICKLTTIRHFYPIRKSQNL